ncbi:MAG TPA: hypothetical protein VND20_01390, partial [Candidatus Binataceae bacterium]|nr:hypothetical protein [Candidatus Binataceae bacterium]
TNHAGRVQRITPALATPPGWMSDGEVFTALLNLVGARNDRFDLADVWAAIARDGGRLATLRFDDIGPHGAVLDPAAGA